MCPLVGTPLYHFTLTSGWLHTSSWLHTSGWFRTSGWLHNYSFNIKHTIVDVSPPLTLSSPLQLTSMYTLAGMYRTIENRHVLFNYNYTKHMTNSILKVTFNLEYKTIDIPIRYNHNQHHTGSSGSFQIWMVRSQVP